LRPNKDYGGKNEHIATPRRIDETATLFSGRRTMKNLLKKTIGFLAAIPLVAGLTISVA
jgi:hypothetical protein